MQKPSEVATYAHRPSADEPAIVPRAACPPAPVVDDEDVWAQDGAAAETEVEVNVTEPVAEDEQPAAEVDVGTPATIASFGSPAPGEGNGVVARDSEYPGASSSPEEEEEVEAVTEQVNAVTEPATVVQAVDTAVPAAAATVVLDELPATGEEASA